MLWRKEEVTKEEVALSEWEKTHQAEEDKKEVAEYRL
jgi:hypothetical protein